MAPLPLPIRMHTSPISTTAPAPCAYVGRFHSWIIYVSSNRLRRNSMLLHLAVNQPLQSSSLQQPIRACTMNSSPGMGASAYDESNDTVVENSKLAPH